MALLPMFLTLLPLSAPGALAPQDLEADLATLRRQRDDAEAEVVVRIADAGTRTAAEGLVELYEGMASVWMRREILRALPRFDGKADAEQVAFDHLFTVGRTTEDPILREAALTGLADAPRLGRGYLARIVESPSADGVRVRAMELHVLGAAATDAAWYGEQFEPQRRVDAQPEKRTRRRRKAAEEDDAPPEEIVHVLPAVRALAFPPIARQFDDARLLEMVRSERMALVRSALLRELEQRGPKELAELARTAVEDLTLRGDLRAEAAGILARAEGPEVADLFIDLARKQEVTPEVLRARMAELLAGMADEGVRKATARLIGKGKPHEKRFALLCTRGNPDEKTLKKVARGLKDKDPLVQRLTVQLLGEGRYEPARKDLAKLLDKADDELLLAEVLRALGRIDGGGDAWGESLLEAAGSEARALRNAALTELGRSGHGGSEQGFGALVAGLGHADWSTRLAAARALEVLREPRVVAPLVERMQQETGRPALELGAILFRLTGQPFRGRASAWKAWLDDTGSKVVLLEPGQLRRLQEEEETRRLKEVSKAAFFGIRVESHRVVFVLDISGSMLEELRARYVGEKGDYRIDRAKKELRQVVENLDEGALFNVIAFNSAVMPWQETVSTSSGATRAECDAWIEKLGALGGTNLFDSLRAAFDDPDVDTIVVLSDGEPSVGELTEPSAIRDEVQRWNRDRGIVIHTVAMGGSFKILEWLAEDSGGLHVRHD